MSPKGWDLGDYVDVNERLSWFFSKYPDGSLQSSVLVGPESGSPFVVVKAYAKRTPDDMAPGHGIAYEPFPGTTPYTKGSELMNAETSAWGRALAAIGAPTKGHVASRNEVQGAASRRSSKPKDVAEQPVPKEAGDQTGPATEAATQPPSGPPALVAHGPPPLPSDHEHTWVQSPNLKSFVVCSDESCRKVERKDAVNA